MDGSRGRPYGRIVLLGRDSERTRLRGALDRARAGEGAALLLCGDPGVGKTALLDDAVSRAGDFQVLRARGAQTETAIGYSGFSELLAPVRRLVDTMDGPAIAALRHGIGLGPPERADLYLAYQGVLEVLAALASSTPVLCVIDDAQWLDAVSMEGTAFLVRRLGAERIAMLIAAREPTEPLDARLLEVVPVDGLTPPEARRLLAAHDPDLLPSVGDALIEATGGNPLALRTIPGQLTQDQRLGLAPLPDPLPLGRTVERALLPQVARLGPGTRSLLLTAAVSLSSDASIISEASADDGSALDAAERAGLIRVEQGTLRFAHPLLRSAVYHSATSGDRRAAHARLATTLRGDAQDRDVWHRAAAAPRPDPELAVALDAAADRARNRCLIDEHLLRERAARMTEDPDHRAARLLAAATAAHGGGRGEYGLALADEALGITDDPAVRADLLEVRLAIATDLGTAQPRFEPALAHAAAISSVDPTRAQRLRSRAWLHAIDRLDAPGASVLRRLATARHEPATSVALAARASHLFIDGAADGAAAAESAARQGARREHESARTGPFAARFGEALTILGDHAAARALLERSVDDAAARGLTSLLVAALASLCELELREGHVAHARIAAERAVAAAEEERNARDIVKALAARASVDAILGEPGCAAGIIEVVRRAAAVFDRVTEVRAYEALGRLHLGAGEPARAAIAFEQVELSMPPAAHPAALRWRPELVEAYVRLDRRRAATTIRDRLAAQAATVSSAWVEAALSRCAALLAGAAEAEPLFAQAKVDATVVSEFDAARVELELGATLRRAGHRIRARDHLGQACVTFERLGARGWLERTRDDLRACGAPVEATAPSPVFSQLTARELEIAVLAAGGATNREIGARLFLSAKTVEVHLSRVYRKLGIRSRTELARVEALREGDPVRPASAA